MRDMFIPLVRSLLRDMLPTGYATLGKIARQVAQKIKIK